MKKIFLISFCILIGACCSHKRESITNYAGMVVLHIQWGFDDLGDTFYNLKDPKTGKRFQVHTHAAEAGLYNIGDTIK